MNSTNDFTKLGLNAQSIEALISKGFEKPTPIQSEIIPLMLKNEFDIIGQAQTGTGKTAAFALPIIEQMQENAKFVQAIILTPTRELALQVSDEINSLKGKRKLHIIPIFGGQSMKTQLDLLKRGVDIVVGTPGRIIDHIKRKSLVLNKVSFLVLDEADEMLNMGFIDDMEKIMKSVNPEKRTALFSATMPDKIRQLAKKYMRETKMAAIKQEQPTTDLTEQIYYEISSKDRFEALCRIIDIEPEFYGLIFCKTKVEVDELSGKLFRRGYSAEALHGDITQFQRNKVLNGFKTHRFNILVATDVAARGLDIYELSHVINYSLPQDPESYIHRIGRTGRAGKKGIAVTFVPPSEFRKFAFIQRIAKTVIVKKKLPEIKEIINSKSNRIIEKIKSCISENIDHKYLKISKTLIKESDPEKIVAAMIKILFENEIDEKKYNQIQEFFSKEKESFSKGFSGNALDKGDRMRLYLSLGKRDGYNPKKISQFIRDNDKIKDNQIDDIAVMNEFSFATVPFETGEKLLSLFKKPKDGKKITITKAREKKK
ncbi:DEAD/DEAH box helicase [Candidatus Dependentiae bacterium]|nr:DEAD/DEAH box helicase [Candidatus Dependentiae bacterium]